MNKKLIGYALLATVSGILIACGGGEGQVKDPTTTTSTETTSETTPPSSTETPAGGETPAPASTESSEQK